MCGFVEEISTTHQSKHNQQTTTQTERENKGEQWAKLQASKIIFGSFNRSIDNQQAIVQQLHSSSNSRSEIIRASMRK